LRTNSDRIIGTKEVGVDRLGKDFVRERFVLALTADIASSYISQNEVFQADLPNLIRSIFAALLNPGVGTPIEEVREPAVSVRLSVKPAAISCLECGAKVQLLKRHLRTDHDLVPADYRTRWGLHFDYPMVAPDYAARRRNVAIKMGLGRNSDIGAERISGRKRGPAKTITAALAVRPLLVSATPAANKE
jgi:predicted transcriptional regulator